jgi:hypothetical protein
MSRLSRLKEYANPMKGPHGSGRDEKNIAYWSNRASENSDGADHRGYDGPMKLPSTGKRTELRDTATAPREARKADARMVAKADTNTTGDSPYLRGIRRNA